jgi:hypothetical protein
MRRGWPCLSGLGLSLLAVASFAAAEGDTSRWSRSGEGTGIELSLPAAVEPARKDPRFRKGVSRLLIRCRDGKAEVGLVAGLLAGHGERAVSVTVRLDQEAATEQAVRSESLSPGLFSDELYHFSKPRTMIEALLAHRSMLVRYAPSGGTFDEASFDLGGLNAVIGTFEQACGIDRPFARGRESSRTPASSPPTDVRPSSFSAGKWSVQTEVSKFDDRATVVATLEAVQPWMTVPGGLTAADPPLAVDPPVLVMRCRDAAAEAYVVQQGRLTRTLRPPLGGLLRFDGGSLESVKLAPSEDGAAFFFEKVPDLAKKMLGARKMSIAFKADEKTAAPLAGEAVFDLTGVDRALEPWFRACPEKSR